jgi:hypothetical protein
MLAPEMAKRPVEDTVRKLRPQLWLPLPTLESKISIARAVPREVPHTMQTSANFLSNAANKNFKLAIRNEEINSKTGTPHRNAEASKAPAVGITARNHHIRNEAEPGSQLS